METELLPDESRWRRDGRWVQLGLFARQYCFDDDDGSAEIEGAETFGLGGRREAWIWERKMGESVLVDDLGDSLGEKREAPSNEDDGERGEMDSRRGEVKRLLLMLSDIFVA
ncbi:uncharacterized protein C8R40DRAFT_1065322 [Lentinula edodes]|uniref:uncharacterized protein n=1 Tax=Lentinula edodes TaxID=5353 RepID=UPI001E8ED5F8|nr:uncharacterized protein C8R40DRAFT_1065322 [Lentinula edodes]KAH7880220.1 hypothetical protein C8R40DRAFT_1065322 [Lentinula edodes]